MTMSYRMTMISLADYKSRVGLDLGVSSWMLVDQARIDAFANVTNDHQFIHVNPELARQTPFGTTIAHGLLTLSLLPTMAYEVMPGVDGTKMGVNYGYNKVRFVAPVKSGKCVRGRFFLKSVDDSKPGEVTSVTEVTVEIEGEDKPALVAEWIGRIYL